MTKTQRHMNRQRSLEGEILGRMRFAMDHHVPIQPITFALSDRVNETKIPQYRKDYLYAYKRALIDWLYCTQAHWQLYLDGDPLTSDEISRRADAETDRIATWKRVKGRHEWKGTNKPFYEDVPPHSLHGETHEVTP